MVIEMTKNNKAVFILSVISIILFIPSSGFPDTVTCNEIYEYAHCNWSPDGSSYSIFLPQVWEGYIVGDESSRNSCLSNSRCELQFQDGGLYIDNQWTSIINQECFDDPWSCYCGGDA